MYMQGCVQNQDLILVVSNLWAPLSELLHNQDHASISATLYSHTVPKNVKKHLSQYTADFKAQLAEMQLRTEVVPIKTIAWQSKVISFTDVTGITQSSVRTKCGALRQRVLHISKCQGNDHMMNRPRVK
jgi:hypothetical protein